MSNYMTNCFERLKMLHRAMDDVHDGVIDGLSATSHHTNFINTSFYSDTVEDKGEATLVDVESHVGLTNGVYEIPNHHEVMLNIQSKVDIHNSKRIYECIKSFMVWLYSIQDNEFLNVINSHNNCILKVVLSVDSTRHSIDYLVNMYILTEEGKYIEEVYSILRFNENDFKYTAE